MIIAGEGDKKPPRISRRSRRPQPKKKQTAEAQSAPRKHRDLGHGKTRVDCTSFCCPRRAPRCAGRKSSCNPLADLAVPAESAFVRVLISLVRSMKLRLGGGKNPFPAGTEFVLLTIKSLPFRQGFCQPCKYRTVRVIEKTIATDSTDYLARPNGRNPIKSKPQRRRGRRENKTAGVGTGFCCHPGRNPESKRRLVDSRVDDTIAAGRQKAAPTRPDQCNPLNPWLLFLLNNSTSACSASQR